jgi:hypothetical protein
MGVVDVLLLLFQLLSQFQQLSLLPLANPFVLAALLAAGEDVTTFLPRRG